MTSKSPFAVRLIMVLPERKRRRLVTTGFRTHTLPKSIRVASQEAGTNLRGSCAVQFTLLMACPCCEVKIQFGGVPMNLFMITIGKT